MLSPVDYQIMCWLHYMAAWAELYIMSQWLREIGLTTLGVSEWNEGTRVLQKLFHARRRENDFDVQCSLNEPLKSEVLNIEDMKDLFIIVVDICGH
ncbi:hypothetical protein NC651_018255 [Populus alba x Populus x berolinensis]|nr:hypothetical protein NC651_018255 [Populus alba x Populus x berolinensis]